MKAVMGFVVVLVGVIGFGACAPRQGDGCDTAEQCGAALSCVSCNASTDAGTGEDSFAGTCQKICETDEDCVGTSGPFGATPICGQNTCGVKYCTIDVQF